MGTSREGKSHSNFLGAQRYSLLTCSEFTSKLLFE